jgi:hypothetical protein
VNPSQTFSYNEGWQMVGSAFSGEPAGSSVLSDVIRYKWNNPSSEYVEIDSYPASEGIWLGAYASGSDQIDGTVGETDAAITLYEGWNLISAPLFRNISVDSITVDDGTSAVGFDAAVNANLLTTPLSYNGSGYVNADELEIFKAYWVGVTQDSLALTLPIHEFPAPAKQIQDEPEDQILLTVIDGNSSQLLEIILENGVNMPAPPSAPNSYKVGLEGESTILGGLYLKYYLSRELADKVFVPITLEGPEREITLKWEVIGFQNFPIMLTSDEVDVNVEGSGEATFSSQVINDMEVALGGTIVSGEVGVERPVEFTISQNYPNPFNPSTTLQFGIPEASNVKLEVFNMLGQKVATLVSEKLQAGYHTARFDAGGLSSGVYIYQIQAGNFTQTKKMLLIK